MQGNCTTSYLVGAGRQQLQNLAQYLQIKYQNNYNYSIKEKLDQNKSYLRTTYVPRTIDSLHGLVSLLSNNTQYDVHTASPDKEPLRSSDCDFVDWYYSYVAQLPEITQYDEQLYELGQKLGYSKDDYFQWWMAQDEFLPRRLLQMDLPNNVTLDDEYLTYKLTDKEWNLEYCNSENDLLEQWLKVSIGAFIPELLNYLNSDKELIIVSAHEESLAPLMKILADNFDCKEPEFASAIEIRLFDDQTIEVDYKANQTILTACNQIQCSVNQFSEYLQQKWSLTWDERQELCSYIPL